MSKRTTRLRVALGEKLQPVGELVFETDGRRPASLFRYATDWLEHPGRFAVAPSMPLGQSPFVASASAATSGSALPRPAGDSTPDAWGRGLIRKASSGVLTELDWLVGVADEARQGALRYLDEDGAPLANCYPPIPHLIELRRLRELANSAESQVELSQADRDELSGIAGSLGGSRPKASIRDGNGALTIAKFTSARDTMPIERAEVATLNLAREAGINAASARLELGATNQPVAMIRRFDRRRRERIGYLSAQAFLGIDAPDGAFYSDIADGLRSHSLEPRQQMAELYRRILFTILVSNNDDHLKNHGLLHAGSGKWVLSPAFDINPQPHRHRQLETGISEMSGNVASIEAAVEAGPLFGLSRDKAVGELAHMVSIIDKRWRAHFRAAGMTSEEVHLYESAFDHEETRVGRRIAAGVKP